MANKAGFMLSIIFLIHSILFAVDLLTYQTLYTRSELHVANINRILQTERDFMAAARYIENTNEGSLVCLEKCSELKAGDFVTYRLTWSYESLFQQGQTRQVSMQRSTII